MKRNPVFCYLAHEKRMTEPYWRATSNKTILQLGRGTELTLQTLKALSARVEKIEGVVQIGSIILVFICFTTHTNS